MEDLTREGKLRRGGYRKSKRLEPSETAKGSAEECLREEVRAKQARAGFPVKEIKPFSGSRNSGNLITVLCLSGTIMPNTPGTDGLIPSNFKKCQGCNENEPSMA